MKVSESFWVVCCFTAMELDFTEMFGEDPPEHELQPKLPRNSKRGCGVAERAPGRIATPGLVVETTTKRKNGGVAKRAPGASKLPRNAKRVCGKAGPGGSATPGDVGGVAKRGPGGHCHTRGRCRNHHDTQKGGVAGPRGALPRP